MYNDDKIILLKIIIRRQNGRATYKIQQNHKNGWTYAGISYKCHCPETEEYGEGERVALIERFDAQGADEIEISFSVSGIVYRCLYSIRKNELGGKNGSD